VTDLSAMRLLLGVGAGIAAYKCAELVRRARERGAQVQVVMTDSAQHFVGAATFQALSGRPVRSSLWDEGAEAAMSHIELARWASQVLIAPATADLIGKLRAGLADDLLTTVCLASAAPLALAPAMNAQMWAHPAVQDNLAALAARGVRVLGPGHGSQACGDVGAGRMWEAADLLDALAVTSSQSLSGRRVVVSAGPTYEDLDPVRFLGNRSSGKMGFAIAQAARDAGAEVQLVAGPVHLPTPSGCRRIDVRSALEMRAAVLQAAAGADIYVGAAAVADYRPASAEPHKIKKGADSMSLQLVRNPDIIAELAVADRPRVLVGFAAETRDVISYAQAKLQAKGLDLIVANRVGPDAAFDRDDNALSVISATGIVELGSGTKRFLAQRLIELLADRLTEQ
jgi:phosphopantothenoylcysteine decarboxylase / phosphopantothenate---cysteine ligase